MKVSDFKIGEVVFDKVSNKNVTIDDLAYSKPYWELDEPDQLLIEDGMYLYWRWPDQLEKVQEN